MKLLQNIFRKQTESEILKVITKAGQILLIIPSQKHSTCRTASLYIVAFATISALNAASIWKRFVFGNHIAALSVLLDSLNTLSTFNVILWFWWETLKNRECCAAFMKSFEFRERPENHKRRYRIYLRIIAVFAYIIAFYVFDCYSWLEIEPLPAYSTYVMEKLEYLYLHCCLLIFCEVIEFIEARFYCINLDLARIISSKRNGKLFLDSGHLTWTKAIINKSIGNYIIATRQIDLFNQIFGVGIFFYYVDVLLGFVLGLNNGIKFLNESIESQEEERIKRNIVILCFAFATIELLTGIKLTMVCRSLTLQLSETGNLVFEALQEFSIMEDGADVGIRQRLVIFCKHTMDVQPYFTAARFFKVDSSLLTDMINSVITYVVMLAQLNKKFP